MVITITSYNTFCLLLQLFVIAALLQLQHLRLLLVAVVIIYTADEQSISTCIFKWIYKDTIISSHLFCFAKAMPKVRQSVDQRKQQVC